MCLIILCLPFIPAQHSLAQTQVLFEIDNSSDAQPENLVVFDNKLFFAAEDASGDNELWCYNVSNNSHLQVANLRSVGSSDPADFVICEGQLYFTAINNSGNRVIWVYDGIAAPVEFSTMVTVNYNSPRDLADFYGLLVFTASNSSYGEELWAYNAMGDPFYASFNSPDTIQDLRPGTTGSNPELAFMSDNLGAIFYLIDDGTGKGKELWFYDGEEIHNASATQINPSGDAQIGDLVDFNGDMYFAADDGTNGLELWMYDGIAPALVANINAGAASSSPSDFAVYDNKLYFSADGGTQGRELWVYTGSGSPSLVADIRTGAASSSPQYLEVFENQLFFQAVDDPSRGVELWSYDGINAPILVDDIHTSGSSTPTELTVYDGLLTFAAEDLTYGREMWAYASNIFIALPAAQIKLETTSSQSGEVALYWQVRNQVQVLAYELQLSEHGDSYETFAKVDPAENQGEIASYQYAHKDLENSAYYRVKRIYANGDSDYSPVKFVEVKREEHFEIYPNPIDRQVSISLYPLEDEKTLFTLLLNDEQGSNIMQGKGTLSEVEKMLKHKVLDLKAGVYMLNLRGGGHNYVRKLYKN